MTKRKTEETESSVAVKEPVNPNDIDAEGITRQAIGDADESVAKAEFYVLRDLAAGFARGDFIPQLSQQALEAARSVWSSTDNPAHDKNQSTFARNIARLTQIAKLRIVAGSPKEYAAACKVRENANQHLRELSAGAEERKRAIDAEVLQARKQAAAESLPVDRMADARQKLTDRDIAPAWCNVLIDRLVKPDEKDRSDAKLAIERIDHRAGLPLGSSDPTENTAARWASNYNANLLANADHAHPVINETMWAAYLAEDAKTRTSLVAELEQWDRAKATYDTEVELILSHYLPC